VDDDPVLELLERAARILLEQQRGHGDMVGLSKLAIVRAAATRAREAGDRHPSVARLMLETGIASAEVKAMRDNPTEGPPPMQSGQSRAERVLRGWWEDARFHDERGRPAILPFRGAMPSIVTLVKHHSGSQLRARLVVRELLKAHAIEEVKDGRYRAVRKTCANVQWNAMSVRNIGFELARHFDGLFHNLTKPSKTPLYLRSREGLPLLERDAAIVLRRLVNAANLMFVDAEGSTARRAANAQRRAGKRKRVWLAVQAFAVEDLQNSTTNGAREKRTSRRNRVTRKSTATPDEVGAR
jgi:hypothetical protein